jgi:YidC/Oxa1 family membrane protein insertase
MQSMRKLQKLKPEMDALKDKYGKDQQRFNQEVWALYRRHKVNPIGGCLPMVLQMPIWIALYTTIAESVELYRARFLYLGDLSAPDPWFAMPIILGGLSFLQSRMSMPKGVPVDPQQKMMLWMMPGMFLMFSLFVPSGLTVYWLANTVLTMIHQWYMNRSDGGTAPATPRR